MIGRCFVLVGAAILTIGSGRPHMEDAQVPAKSPTASQAQLDKDLVDDFTEHVDDYMKLHQKLQKQGTPQTERQNAGENQASQKALAMRIRSARRDARPGDLFTQPIAKAIRRALDPELRGAAALTTRQTIREDAPATFVLAVNADYPAGASRASMPANVLSILPPLPKGLEYLIVGNHLLLMDVDANIIVDYILDVMCKAC